MPYKLSGLTLDRVDLVPDGSNPDAHIVLFKAKKGKHMPASKKKVAKKPVAKKPDSRKKQKQRGDEDDDDDEDIDKALDDDEEDDEDLEEDEDDEEEDVEKSDDEDDDEDEDDEEDDDEEEKPRKKSKSKKPATRKKVAKSDEDDEDLADEDDDAEDDDDVELDEAVIKAMPKAQREQFIKAMDAMNAKLARVEKRAARGERLAGIEKAKRERVEFIEKAKRVIPMLPGTAEEKGELIQALYSGEPVEKKTADALVKLLKSGDKAVATMMRETGHGRARTDEEDDAISQLREKAAALKKADPKLTKEQAFAKACDDNRELYAQYRVEKRRGTRDTDAH